MKLNVKNYHERVNHAAGDKTKSLSCCKTLIQNSFLQCTMSLLRIFLSLYLLLQYSRQSCYPYRLNRHFWLVQFLLLAKGMKGATSKIIPVSGVQFTKWTVITLNLYSLISWRGMINTIYLLDSYKKNSVAKFTYEIFKSTK